MELKVHPHDILAEQALICGMLINPSIIPQVSNMLTPLDFYKEAHMHIVEGLFDLNKDANAVSLNNWLVKKSLQEKCGGIAYLFTLGDAVSTWAGWKSHTKIIKDLSIKRQLILACSTVAGQCYNTFEDNEEIFGELTVRLREIQSTTKDTKKTFDNKELYNTLYDETLNDKSIVGYTTGIPCIDEKYYLEPKCTTVIAAESGIGKSAISLQIADHVSNKYGKVLYFSMESTRLALARRQLARHSKVALTRLKKHHINELQVKDISDAINILTDSNLIIIDDTQYQDIERLIVFCQSIAIENDIKLIVIDYLQLLSSKKNSQNRHLEISDISKKCNFLAKELNCHVIIISQLRKDVNRRPKLEDLKESGDIRNNADNILFLYSPNSDPIIYPVEVRLAKGKDIEFFKTWLEFNGNFQTFSDGIEPEIPKKQKVFGYS